MSEPTEFVDGLVHEPTQTGEIGVDLTVGRVARLDGRGQLDFGGDEYRSPDGTAVETERRHEDDEYGWWELDAGTYAVGYNESLSASDDSLLLQPHPRLLAVGVTHPTVRVRELPRVPITVPESGVAIKENARVSRVE